MRRGFAPVVLLGLIGAVLGAVAGNRPWVTLPTTVFESGRDDFRAPLAGALAFVTLACWGVVLVTRRRVRRAVALLGAAGAAGVLVTALAVGPGLPDQVTGWSAERNPDPSLNGWFWATLAGAVLALAGFLAAFVLAPRWPEMGSRYDAPGTVPATSRASDVPPDADSFDVWKAIDEGHDPTESRTDGRP